MGRMVPPAPAGTEIPPEPPDVGARALSVAARLLAGATTFFFLSFVFAYFYLRSLNQQHAWRPAHINPDQGLGGAMIACLVLSALLTLVAGRRMRGGSRAWLGPAFAAVILGIAAIALQCIEYTRQHFGPTDGAYASVFVTWTALYLIAVIFTMYWLETNVASALRARARIGRGEPPPTGDIEDPARQIAPGMDAAVFYWCFLVGIGVIMYVVLYLL
jgi:heme/copper-type cytochrome/quinol oxidase subunit 3